MPLKTYETIGILNRHVAAVIDGREVTLPFINGTDSPRKIQGRFTTKDPKIQEWIENSGNYNVKYRLVSIVLLPEEKPHPELIPGTPAKIAKITDPYDDLAKVRKNTPEPPSAHDDMGTAPPPDLNIPEETDEDLPPDQPVTVNDQGITVVGEGVVNGQQARNYLIEHYKDLTFRQVANNAQIIAEAKARNIQFTHWEAFVTSK